MNIPNLEQYHPTEVIPPLISFDAGSLLRRLKLPPGGTVAGFTFALDGTLLSRDEDTIPERNLELLTELASQGMRLGFIADIEVGAPDARERIKRARRLVRQVKGLPLEGHPEESAEDSEEQPEWPIKSLGVTIPAKLRVKRSDPLVFDNAADGMVLPKTRLVHVGSRLRQDVWAANCAGYAGSVLVPHYGAYEDWREEYVRGLAVAMGRRVVGVPLLSRNFGQQTR